MSKPSELRSWIVVLEQGEEAKHLLIQWATREKIENASFVALGAFEKAVVGYFDIEKKEYQPIPIAEQVEVITLVGDIFPDDRGNPSLHGHAVLGRRDDSTRGGHLLEGYVRPTLEVAVTELPAHLRRHMHPELGVALIEPA
jgi:predicted DNA-binding protein with PD1-like motif